MARDARTTALAYSWDNVFSRVYQRYEELITAQVPKTTSIYRAPGLSAT